MLWSSPSRPREVPTHGSDCVGVGSPPPNIAWSGRPNAAPEVKSPFVELEHEFGSSFAATHTIASAYTEPTTYAVSSPAIIVHALGLPFQRGAHANRSVTSERCSGEAIVRKDSVKGAVSGL